jgi:hypothetical protein
MRSHVIFTNVPGADGAEAMSSYGRDELPLVRVFEGGRLTTPDERELVPTVNY